MDIDFLIVDIEAMRAYALRHKIPIDASLLAQLHDLFIDRSKLHRSGPAQSAFLDAYGRLGKLIPVTAPEIRSTTRRCRRLTPMLQEAESLQDFAITSGKAIPDGVPMVLASTAAAIESGMPTLNDEVAFINAYQSLTKLVTPVSAATLASSRFVWPKLDLSLPFPYLARGFQGMTVGRFFHFFFFVLVLALTAFGLSILKSGEIASSGFLAKQKALSEFQQQATTLRTSQDMHRNALVFVEATLNVTPEALSAARAAVIKVASELDAIKEKTIQLEGEKEGLLSAMADWKNALCLSWWARWGCIDTLDTETAASAMLTGLNNIFMPLLLGLLGAYSFVLRNISLEIREHRFAPHSLLHHLARLSLGALAGIAAGWLIAPEQHGLLKAVPAWTLAFLAGYGSELVFALMDRIITSLTAKP
jgi:hypothetical protein